MMAHSHSAPGESLQTLSRVAGMMVAIIGGMVVGGWLFSIPGIKAFAPGQVTMKPSSAGAFLLLGVSLVLWRRGEDKVRRWCGQGLAGLVAIAALLVFIEYLFGWDLRLQSILFHDPPALAGTTPRGRMAQITALSFLILGPALILLHAQRAIRLIQMLSLMAGLVSFLVLTGYAYDPKSLHGMNFYSQMAIHTAGTFVLLCLGILFARPQEGVMRRITSPQAGGVMIRRLLPAVLLIPGVLGWLRILGEREGFYGTEFGLAMTVACGIVFFAALIWWNAGLLNRLEARHTTVAGQVRSSEERFRAVAQTANDAIISSDGNGLITYVNTRAEQMFGYPANDMIGRPITVIMPERFHQSHARGLARVLAGGEPHVIGRTVELAGRRADGSEFPLELSLASWRTTEGAFFTAIIRDITERKKSERIFKGLLESAPDAILIVNPQGTIVLANPQAESLFGYGRDELRDKKVEILLPERYRHKPGQGTEFFAKPKRSLSARGYELCGVRKDGTEFPIEMSHSPLESESGPLAINAIRDISDRKRKEEEIQKLYVDLDRRAKELEAVNKELQSFAYSVSHDLRAPLRAIDGFSKALAEDAGDNLPAAAREDLQRVRAASRRMGELIDDLLALSRVTRTEMKPTNVDMSSLAESILGDLQKSQPDRRVHTEVMPGLIVNADANLLRIGLENLLGNAWKFTAKKPDARIELGMLHQNGESVYFVRDNGAGFDMEFADKLFGPFQRLHRIDEFEGTGIGLATVQRVIHRHGGKVWGKGELEKGATFYFTLPR